MKIPDVFEYAVQQDSIDLERVENEIMDIEDPDADTETFRQLMRRPKRTRTG